MLTVYTKPNCQPCRVTKIQMNRLGINFTEIDITENPEALEYVKSLGHLSAPVVVDSAGNSWAGFKPDRINEYE